MHDISDIERRGVPGVFVSTVHFASAVTAQSESLGFDAAAVLTHHPIQDQTDDEMTAIADAAFDDLVKALVGPA
ncbi:MAG: hypothetical protein F4Z00_07910 [Acidimicrobiaceae bacterium]|nr:hypothetical protein [Acidimicrobiaceae bacterium]MXZ65461.1 hypothetical protein [Acidimicrobiaceae bacterium]MYF34277.1 hypothetical protein [Acidimicrobiaceae bacterium]MYG80144.1 hypothetical protein [Acidimicrobiaceae bacterium]MYJ29632.1 hypothetical protein [Acidimicrobiaceae bacterium]